MCWKCGENSEDDSDAVSAEEEEEEIAEPPMRGIIKKQPLQNEICIALDKPDKPWSLEPALQKWTQTNVEHLPENENIWARELIYRLEHQYTETSKASLDILKLQGVDLAKAQTLQRFGQRYGFTVLLATMERFVMTGEYETFDDVVTLERVFDLSGNLLVSGVPTNEKNVLQAEVYSDNRKPDDSEHEDYMGKPGKDSDKFWYRDIVSAYMSLYGMC